MEKKKKRSFVAKLFGNDKEKEKERLMKEKSEKMLKEKKLRE